MTPQPPYVWQTCLHSETLGHVPEYHDVARPDLFRNLDIRPRRALDVGCGGGATFAELKKIYPHCETWGIEINPGAAEAAKKRLDHVAAGRVEDIDFPAFGIAPGSLDLILCADVLEHLYDPWATLLKLKTYLAEEGRLIISIPNLRYLPLLDELSRGYFRYASFGPLDITHIRFFTRQELARLCHETGFIILDWRHAVDPAMQPLIDKARQGRFDLDLGKLVLREIDEAEALDLASAQFHIMLRKGEQPLRGYRQPFLSCYFWQGTRRIEELIELSATQPSRVENNTRFSNLLLAHRLERHEARAFDAYFSRLGGAPRFDVCVFHAGDDGCIAAFLSDAARWLYDAYRLVVFSSQEAPAAIRAQSAILWRKIDSDGTAETVWRALGEHLAASSADWFIVLESGDRLSNHALLYLGEAALRHPQATLIYADEGRLDAAMQPSDPLLKPDFSPDYFLSCDYLGSALAIQRQAWLAIPDIHASERPLRRAALEVFRERGAGAFVHVPDVLWHRAKEHGWLLDTPPTDVVAESAAIFPEAKIAPGYLPGSVRHEPTFPASAKVCVIAEASAPLSTTQALVERFLEQAHKMPHAELVLFAAPDLPSETLSFLAGLDALGSAHLVVFPHPPGLDASGRIAAAIAQSDANAFLVLGSDCLPVDADWLVRLAALALEKDRGLVAPRLVDGEKRLLGNCLLFGLEGFAVGLGGGAKLDEPGYAGRLLTPQNPLAVTPEVIAFSRATWEAGGGLTSGIGLLAATTAFALRLHEAGRRTLWTPYLTFAVLARRLEKLAPEEENTLAERWLPVLARDPAYNINLSRKEPFQLTERPQITRLCLPWKPLPRLIAFPADNMGCGHYRVIEPFQAACAAGLLEGHLDFVHPGSYDLAVFAPDTIYLQRQVTDEQLEHLRHYRRFFKSHLVYEIDDLTTHVPATSLHKPHIPKDIAQRLRKGFSLCDRLVVTTEPLAEAFAPIAPEIRIIPNYLDRDKWGALTSRRRVGKKPRVGWAGGVSHTGDLALIIDLVRATAEEVDWVFMGFCLEEIKPYVRELVPGVPTPQYPARLATLDLDLAIAPLAENAFNDCKSNLRLLEYGALGWPVIASDFGPYRRSRDFPGVTLVKNRFKDWLAALREHIHDLDECARRGDALREHLHRHWMLQDHLEEWRRAWFDF